ncbi:hypothetical protein [Miniimonas sp. S16]|uniref:hypothetical protein n=1 Tax=Miniimonas sp. S16 TaxID=2171623 RepID=UPI00131EFFBE|nr:hypothetical protein [Miniimonas sp. S16]
MLREDEAFVVQERHLTDSAFEASALDVPDKAHVELSRQRIHAAAVPGTRTAILFDDLAVDLGDQLSEALNGLIRFQGVVGA